MIIEYILTGVGTCLSTQLNRLISRSQFITICREPKCCGGPGESNKILGYLDKYFFNGSLRTVPIR